MKLVEQKDKSQVDEDVDLRLVLLFDEFHLLGDGGLAERNEEGEEGEGVLHGYES